MENFYSFFLNYDYTIRSDQIEAEAEPSGNVEATGNSAFDQCNLLSESPPQSDASVESNQYMQAHDLIGADEALSATETPAALTERHQYSTTGMRINGQQWTATPDAHEAPFILQQHAWPRDAHGLYGTMNFPSWTMDSSVSNYVPPYPTTALTNSWNDPSLTDSWQDVPYLDSNHRSTTSQSSRRRFPSQMDQVGPEWDQEPRTVADLTDTQDPPSKIGSVLENGKFMCDSDTCAGRTFARHPELRRHYTTIHAARKPTFWCEIPKCRRSIRGGGEAFHRRDKLVSHVRSMHPEVAMM